MPVWRTWNCLNRRCRNTFNAQEDFPPCPRCGGLRVNWIPRPVAVHGASAQNRKTIVNEVEEQARAAGIDQIRSTMRGDPAATRVTINTAVGGRTSDLDYEPVSGWKVRLPAQALSGRSGASVCAPTGMTAPLKNADYNYIDKVQPVNHLRGPTPVIEAAHRPKGK